MIIEELEDNKVLSEQVLRKRPYLQRKWCEQALYEYEYYEKQADGRVRYWIYIEELGMYLRVVTLADGQTVHNAFPDRDFVDNK